MKTQKFLLILLVIMGIVSSSFAQVGGPPPDRDGDGVPDSSDDCISDRGPASNNGCPVDPTLPDAVPPDSDGDGTADPLDRCPNEAGDGANGGCPENSNTNASSPAVTPEMPLAAPTTGECVVSTQGSTPINIREYPNLDAEIVGVISPNEWVEVLGRFDYGNFYFSQHGMGAGLGPEPQLPILFDPFEPEYVVWFLVQDSNSPALGWVAEALVRMGGDCSEWIVENPNPDAIYMQYKLKDVLVTSFSGGVRVAAGDVDGDGAVDSSDYVLWRRNFGSSPVIPVFPSTNPFFAIPTDEPLAAAYIKFDGVDGESTAEAGQSFVSAEGLPDGCELMQLGDGSVMPVCDDGSTPETVVICTYQEVLEVGVFSEVCYEVEIPEGCVLESPEAGIWKITCDETVDNIQINPFGEPDPILDITWGEDTVQIALLLPAVQKVREAAARIRA